MFGYIVVNKPEMKFREFDVYQSYYCGLCRSLKDRYGNLYTGNYYPKDKNHKEDCFAVEFLEWGFQGSQFCKISQITEWCEIPKYTEE